VPFGVVLSCMIVRSLGELPVPDGFVVTPGGLPVAAPLPVVVLEPVVPLLKTRGFEPEGNVLPDVPGMLRWLCSAGLGAALGVVVLGVPNAPLDDVPLEDVPVEDVPLEDVPLDVPVPVEVPDPLVPEEAPPDEVPAEPEPLDPPDAPPPLWASADAGHAATARRRANVLSFMCVLPGALGFALRGKPGTPACVPRTRAFAAGGTFALSGCSRCETDRKAKGG
jgi:hypothetical protein